MIKILIITHFLLLISILSVSQNYADNVIISASVSGAALHLHDEDPDAPKIDQSSVRLNLKAGYFLWDRSAIGIYGGYFYQKNKTEERDTITSGMQRKEFYIGPYYKLYLKLFKGFNFTLFSSVYYRYSIHKPLIESQYPMTENSYNLSLVPGLSYDITPRLSIDLDVGEFTAYILNFRRKDPTLDEEQQKVTTFRTNTSFNRFRLSALTFGFSYKIGNR